MTSPRFQVVDARAEPYAMVPTLIFRVQLEDPDLTAVRHLALKCQIRIEPERRRYSIDEEDQLLELFGKAFRWNQTLHPFLWMQTSLVIPRAVGTSVVELPVPCTYDFEVIAAKYLHALRDGDIPLRFLFSGSVFSESGSGVSVTQIPWDREATFQLPVRLWRELMNQYFPNAGWLRLRRESLDGLLRFKANRALGNFDEVIQTLLSGAGER